MTSTANERLVTLVSNYYHGLVTFQSYRQQRASILDGLRDPAPSGAEVTARAAPAKKPAADRSEAESAARAAPTKPVAADRQVNPLPAADRGSSRRWVAWGGAAAAVAVVVAGWIAFERSSETPSVVEQNESAPLSPGAVLLDQFMRRNAWDRDAIQNLETAWSNALTEDQRQAATSSATYGRFSETLRGRLREEEALGGLDGSAELETLAALADRFGVPYSRARGRAAAGTSAAATAAPPSPVPATPAAVTDAPAPVANEQAVGAEGEAQEPGAGPAQSEGAPAPPLERVATSAETAADSAAVPAEEPSSSAVTAPAAAGATAAVAGCSAALLSTRRPYCSDALSSGGTGPNLAIVPPGEFEMGGEQTNDEKPPHAVTIGRAFAVSVYEVSWAEFGAYCRAAGERCPDNPWGSDDFPVALVSWDEAVAYARWLSSETGQSYRLPSEAEWEYAARAGSRTRYPFGDDVTPVAARSSANGPVNSPLANSDRSVNRNAFRLFHMIGNVREWVADHWYSGYAGAPTDGTARLGAEANPRVVRGGSYSDGPLQLRSAARIELARDTRDRLTGFRVVRDLPP